MQLAAGVQAFHLVQHFPAVFRGDSASDSPDQDIFRSMLQINELQQLGFVTAGFEQVGSDVVSYQSGTPLLDDAVTLEKRQF